MKLKHKLVILFGFAAVGPVGLAIHNLVTEKYLLSALHCVGAVCYFGLAAHWANRED